MQVDVYARNTFDVKAVQVTNDNMEEVAAWCGGEIQTDDDGNRFIKVKVYRPMNEDQTQARIGKFVSLSDTGYKVYTEKAFKASFSKKEDKPAAIPMPKG